MPLVRDNFFEENEMNSMMRPLFLCLSFCCLWQLGMGQYLHTPSDFDKKIGSSSITYLLDSLFEPPAAQNMPLVTAGWIAVPRDGGVRLIAPSLETQTARAKYRVKGDNFFEKGKFLKAAANYEKLAPAGGTDVELMKRLGESYRKGGNWEKASYWYTQAIDANFIDFVAHQRLAECYEATDNGEKAIHHITLAHLLNRNDAGILGAVRKMYEANGHPFANYEFVPGYELS
ncbi:MAG: tetratricopeptide repeat protein, partial [Bacteroidota bacterium]